MIHSRAKKQAYIYIAFMAVIIFFSKTIYNYSLPRVTVGRVTGGALEKTLTGYGALAYSKTYDVFAGQSGRVTDVFSEVGARLEPFSDILRIENKYEQADIEQARFNLGRLELSLARLESDKSEAEEELAVIKNKTESDFRFLDMEIGMIEEELADKAREAEEQYILYQAGALSLDTYEASLSAVKDAENRLLIKKAEKEEAAIAEDEEKQEKIEAKESELREIEDSLKEARLDMSSAEAEFSRMNSVEVQTVTSKDRQGILTEIYVQEGEFAAPGSRIATVALPDENFRLEIVESKAAAGFINLGDKAEFSSAGQTSEAAVAKIESEGESLRIEFIVVPESFEGGAYGQIRLSKVTPVYEILVPNDAVIRTGAASEVWLLKSRQSALGTELYVQKTKVFAIDQDEDFTAISRGLTAADVFVIAPPEGLENNQRVLAE